MATIGSFNVTKKSHGAYPDAVQLFTDRENPQEVFERKLKVIEEHRKEAFAVLCYYGIGGIGKTSLKNKLCRVIDGVPGNPRRVYEDMKCYHICYDFGEEGAVNDKRSILTRLYRQIQGLDKRFQFYLFETALVMYAKKTGTDITQDETTSVILDKNPWLNSAVNTLGLIPIISWSANALQALDSFAAAVSNKWTESRNQKKYEEELQRISGYEASDILRYLHEWFIMDMCANMETVSDRPLVIFFDTYERYVESMYDSHVSKDDDRWLRDGEDSLLQSIPGILWVILGRERLAWDESDDFWKSDIPERPLDEMTAEEKEALAYEVLEQHLLGELSRRDALDYFKRAGVEEEELAGQIYDNLTGGTPLFLDICVQEYRKIRKTGTPKLEDFGQDIEELVKRYIKGLTDADREMAGLLALLGTWTDDLVEEVVPGITELKYFTRKKYEAFCKHSFVIRDADGQCYIHETVRRACLVEADTELAQGVKREYQKWAKARMEDSNKLDYVENAYKYITNLFKSAPTYEKVYEEVPTIREMLNNICLTKADVVSTFKVAKIIYDNITALFPGTGLQMTADVWLAESYAGIGRYAEVEEMVKPYRDMDTMECPEDMDEGDFYIIMCHVGEMCRLSGDAERMERLSKKAYDSLSGIPGYGKFHFEALKAYDSWANALSIMGKHKEALEAYKYVLFYYENKLGRENADTLTTMSGIGIELQNLGRYEEALKIRQEVYELRKKVLGENHYSTLTAYKNVGTTLTSLGQYEEAFRIDEYVYGKNRELLGEKHPNTLNAYLNLAWDYEKKGDTETALRMRTEVYEIRKSTLGEKHTLTLSALSQIANTYYYRNETEEAVKLHLQVYELRKEVLGERHLNTVTSLLDIAFDYYDLSDYQKAYEYAKKAYDARTELLGAENPDTLKALDQVAKNLYYLNREAEAYEYFELEYRARAKSEDAKSKPVLNCLDYMGKCRYFQGKYKEAQEILEPFRCYFDDAVPETEGILADGLDYLGKTYVELKMTDKALETYKFLYPFMCKKYGEKNRRTLNIMRRLAEVYEDISDNEAALGLYTSVYEAQREAAGEEDGDTIRYRSDQLVAMYNSGKREDAYAGMKSLYELCKGLETCDGSQKERILSFCVIMARKLKDTTKEGTELQKEMIGLKMKRAVKADGLIVYNTEARKTALDINSDMDSLIQIYRKSGRYSEALEMLEKQRRFCTDYLDNNEEALKKIDKMEKIIRIEMS